MLVVDMCKSPLELLEMPNLFLGDFVTRTEKFHVVKYLLVKVNSVVSQDRIPADISV